MGGRLNEENGNDDSEWKRFSKGLENEKGSMDEML